MTRSANVRRRRPACFEPDARTGRHRPHKLTDLIVVALLAVIRGADGWVQVAQWARARSTWLATFLKLGGGIPSHDTSA
jgi:hypothetical protein